MSSLKNKTDKELRDFLRGLTEEAIKKIQKEKTLKGKFYQFGRVLLRLSFGLVVYWKKSKRLNI